MNKRSGILIFALVVALCSIVAWQPLRRREPVYQGKRESFWINSLNDPDAGKRDVRQWQSLGPDAVPLLLKTVERGNGPLHAPYAWIWPELPLALRNRCPKPVDRSWPRQHALNVLSEIARDAPIPVAPLLIALRDNDPQVSMSAAGCIASLLRTGNLSQEKRDITPALIRALQDNSAGLRSNILALVRNNVVVALGYCGDQAEIVVPVLLKTLQDPDADVRSVTTNALKRIAAQATDKVGVRPAGGPLPVGQHTNPVTPRQSNKRPGVDAGWRVQFAFLRPPPRASQAAR